TDLPHHLKLAVAETSYGPIVDRCASGPFALLRNCNREFIREILLLLQEEHLRPCETFVVQNEMGFELSFLSKGTVEFIVSGLEEEEAELRRASHVARATNHAGSSSNGGAMPKPDQPAVRRHTADGEMVLKSLNAESPDISTVIGELAFFVSIPQVCTVRVTEQGNAARLVLPREKYTRLIATYPEQHQMIMQNLVNMYGLDLQGNELANAVINPFLYDQGRAQMQRVTTMLKHHLVMQHVTSMAELMDAAIVSSGEDVMRLIRLGIDINTQNYDGQTVLHIAAAHGNIAVVQMLVEQGIDLNLRDRWGHTALQEALRRDELSTVRFLDKKGSKMYVDDAAAALCNAASQGNPDEVAVLLKNGVSVNGADYDLRTALHVACSLGYEKVVDLLLSHGAEVSVKDRWGFVPLYDAVKGRHAGVVHLLRAAGAELPHKMVTAELCSAAVEGHQEQLNLLRICGVDLDMGDYDNRTALMLSAANNHLACVSNLLCWGADVDQTDRWGNNALSEAYKAGHAMVARLLVSAGAELPVLKGDQNIGLTLEGILQQLDTLAPPGLQQKEAPSTSLEEEVAQVLQGGGGEGCLRGRGGDGLVPGKGEGQREGLGGGGRKRRRGEQTPAENGEMIQRAQTALVENICVSEYEAVQQREMEDGLRQLLASVDLRTTRLTFLGLARLRWAQGRERDVERKADLALMALIRHSQSTADEESFQAARRALLWTVLKVAETRELDSALQSILRSIAMELGELRLQLSRMILAQADRSTSPVAPSYDLSDRKANAQQQKSEYWLQLVALQQLAVLSESTFRASRVAAAATNELGARHSRSSAVKHGEVQPSVSDSALSNLGLRAPPAAKMDGSEPATSSGTERAEKPSGAMLASCSSMKPAGGDAGGKMRWRQVSMLLEARDGDMWDEAEEEEGEEAAEKAQSDVFSDFNDLEPAREEHGSLKSAARAFQQAVMQIHMVQSGWAALAQLVPRSGSSILKQVTAAVSQRSLSRSEEEAEEAEEALADEQLPGSVSGDAGARRYNAPLQMPKKDSKHVHDKCLCTMRVKAWQLKCLLSALDMDVDEGEIETLIKEVIVNKNCHHNGANADMQRSVHQRLLQVSQIDLGEPHCMLVELVAHGVGLRKRLLGAWADRANHPNLHAIQEAIGVIEKLYAAIPKGNHLIAKSTLGSMQECLGEVGGVIFNNMFPLDELPDWLAKSDFYVLVSLYANGHTLGSQATSTARQPHTGLRIVGTSRGLMQKMQRRRQAATRGVDAMLRPRVSSKVVNIGEPYTVHHLRTIRGHALAYRMASVLPGAWWLRRLLLRYLAGVWLSGVGNRLEGLEARVKTAFELTAVNDRLAMQQIPFFLQSITHAPHTTFGPTMCFFFMDVYNAAPWFCRARYTGAMGTKVRGAQLKEDVLWPELQVVVANYTARQLAHHHLGKWWRQPLRRNAVLLPDTWLQVGWHRAILAIYMFNAIWVPMRNCFGLYPSDGNLDEILSRKPWLDAMDILEVAMDAALLGNVAVRMNTAIGSKNSALIYDRPVIRASYMANGMALDLACALPLNWLARALGASRSKAGWLRMTRVLGLANVAKQERSRLQAPLMDS
ncbi:hypothetical protein CYMTET_11875, partial [Cymbomonas tetramitiformis]